MKIAIRLNSKEDYFTLCKLFLEMKIENEWTWNEEFLNDWGIYDKHYLLVFDNVFELHSHDGGFSKVFNSVNEYLTTH